MKSIKPGDGLWGDAVLYWGIASACGDSESNEQVLNSFSEITGRLHRNTYIDSKDTSRDMMLGALLSSKEAADNLYIYLNKNRWKLSPTSKDARHLPGILGRIQVSFCAGKGFWRHAAWILPFVLLLSANSPRKKPFELHLDICTLLLYRRFKWSRVNRWLLEMARFSLETLSRNNAIIRFMDKDLEKLIEIRQSIRNEDAEVPNRRKDHWSFATYEQWRDIRMAHPACEEWLNIAIENLQKTEP